jgi:GNAT superfamily N-acetyltransferase
MIADIQNADIEAVDIAIRPATVADVGIILECICGLAEYERLSQEVRASEEALRETLFGERAFAEVLIASLKTSARGGDSNPEIIAGFALFFHNYSTFLAKPGIYLEDLFVKPEFRGRGVGKALLARLARVAVERNCGRLEWSVLDWNEPALQFYRSLGAQAMDEWTTHRLTGESLRALALLSGGKEASEREAR